MIVLKTEGGVNLKKETKNKQLEKALETVDKRGIKNCSGNKQGVMPEIVGAVEGLDKAGDTDVEDESSVPAASA